MKGNKCIKFLFYCLVFICALGFLGQSKDVNAVSVPGLNFLKVSYSFNGGSFQELVRHNSYFALPDTLLAIPATANTELMNYFVVSANLPSSSTGVFFNGSINFEIMANADNSFTSLNCSGITGYIYPEQGSISESQSRAECSVSNNGRILNVSIITVGKLLSEVTASTWYSLVQNNDNNLFSCSNQPGVMSAPCRQQEIKIISANINFNLTRDATVAGLDTIINQNQTIINQNQTIIEQNQDTYDYLTDDTPPDVDTSVLGSSAGWLPPGPVDSILTLPVQLAQGLVNVFTNPDTCQPIVLPFNFLDSSITIPCMSSYFSASGIDIVWNAVGTIISAFIIYNTLKWLYKFVDETLTLRENDSTLWGGL